MLRIRINNGKESKNADPKITLTEELCTACIFDDIMLIIFISYIKYGKLCSYNISYHSGLFFK